MPYLGTTRRMGSIGRYIFRTTISAFLVILISLTAVIWVTQALHDIDLMTTQGQSILIFVGITGMIIPLLILVIAPIALLIAVVHVLNKMSTDSEIIVMNASGMSPWILFRAFLAAAVVVSILVMAVSAYFAPKGLRMLSDWLTEVHADVVGNLVQPGRFTNVASGVTMRIRERRSNGQMVGIFLDDQRDPAQRVTVIADVGEVLNSPSGTFLVLQNGMVQRFEAKERDPTMVVFDRYAFDLSTLIPGRQAITYSIRERYLWQLLFPDPNDKLYSQRAEPVPCRTARPDDRADLSDRVRGDRIRLSGSAAHQPAKPHDFDARRHRRRGAAAAGRIRVHRVRRHHAVDAGAAIRGARACFRRRPVRDPPRTDPGVARLHRQLAGGDHRARDATRRHAMSSSCR